MKKVLSSLLLVSMSMIMFGQVVVSDNFTSYNNGNLSTDITGATAGQGSWYTQGGAVTNYQITTIDAAHGKSMSITSGAGAANTDSRFTWKSFSTTATASNNYIVGKFDIYTGAAAGASQYYCTLYSTVPIAAIVYDTTTKKFIGAGRYTNASGVATFASFGTLGTNTYPANTWVTVSVAYNKTNGSFYFTTPQGTYSVTSVTAPAALIPNLTATEADFYIINATGNTVANTAVFDNIQFQFATTATLGTSESKDLMKDLSISVYPNPTSEFLNIKTDSKINAVSVVDMTGRKVDVKISGSQVDVRSLSTGTYLITVETKEGTSSQKFIKK
ncbi:T9SS type A sorting domain-containing protein [Chryseobacterium profundimaris]|uniref:Por secretion system C-terminal sorting domain-containing protein n=1 Tax=Chryseobacterium profundimaris TaxID=1387275 RepID=A0ABY1NH83_9FLAO|nr:T9SS type A sorting domain-containing protein [Chryseobacterium profundimaris]SMP09782.1 Por secretion system C-terminal sorting domain-containing protein [Chryseobacterium profundimaris]